MRDTQALLERGEAADAVAEDGPSSPACLRRFRFTAVGVILALALLVALRHRDPSATAPTAAAEVPVPVGPRYGMRVDGRGARSVRHSIQGSNPRIRRTPPKDAADVRSRQIQHASADPNSMFDMSTP